MMCQHCGKNEATFYYKSTVNGRATQAHLCHTCACELGYADALRPERYGFFSDPFALLRDEWFGGIASRLLTEFPAPGNTLAEAKETVQRKETDNLLGEEESRVCDLQRQRNALEYRLHLAVDAEDYEEAARLRDELRALLRE
jgi:protein arginine kinase activator